jgi:tetratricopeptide (TPR) repeat protein
VRAWKEALAAAAVCLLALPARADPTPTVADGHRRLQEWLVGDARRIAERLMADDPDDPAVLRLAARVKFHEGAYPQALKLLDQADASIGRPPDGSEDDFLRRVVTAARDITRDYDEARVGSVIIRTPPGKDAVLVPYAAEALESALAALSKDLAYPIEPPILVEVYPGPEELAAATTLTVQEIETSGTIAVCKFNRLMITSPKALARGYTWLDTLSHEFVHFVISMKSRNNLPIWLQEAFAKYFETRWRGAAGQALRPSSANLLAEALAKDVLITFEQMSPSMAKLPSQDAAALAFAEVFTVMEFVMERGGQGMANAIIDHMRDGLGDREAVAKATGMSFGEFEQAWRRWLRKRKLPTVPGARVEALAFKKSRSMDEGEVEEGPGDLRNDAARRHLRLGEILRARGRLKAAVTQYEKAVAAVRERGEPHAHVLEKLGVAYLQAARSADAERVFLDALKIDPTSVTTHTHLGRLYFERTDHGNAEHHYLMANRVNPFNPEIHMALRTIYEAGGQGDLAAREGQSVDLLMAPGAQRERPIDRLVEHSTDAGLLTIYSVPWAEVSLDGKPTGLMTPLLDHEVPAGRHEVELWSRAANLRHHFTVEVPAGRAVRRSIDLKDAAR